MADSANILIIDDEQVIINSIRKIAEFDNLSTDFSLNGIEALDKIFSNEYDLIICDIMLPEITGFQILDEIESKNIKTPVVVTTGFPTVENAVTSLYIGAIDFIAKPFSLDEMLSTIRRGIEYSKFVKQKKRSEPSDFFVPCPAKYFRFGYSCWINKDSDGTVLFGATDIFLKTIKQILKIELSETGVEIVQAFPSVKFETDDGCNHTLYSAISGTIIQKNVKVVENPDVLEKDPYFKGWLYRILPANFEQEMQKLIPCSSDRN